MQPSSQYDVLQHAGLGANHPYVMRNNYWTSPASAAAVRQFPYYSKWAVNTVLAIKLAGKIPQEKKSQLHLH